jgi:hypothetical protein
MAGERKLLSAFRPMARKLLRSVPSPVLPMLLLLPRLPRLVGIELVRRGWEWRPARGLGQTVDLVPGLPQGDKRAMRKARALLRGVPGPEVSVHGSAHLVWGGDIDFSGQRVAVVAHWDTYGRLDPYVAHYLRHLRDLGWRTVLASATPLDLDPEEGPGADAVVYRSCPGYDFTSWKAAFHCLPSLFRARELVLTNDSIFAPVGSLASVHEIMDRVSCDFWGMVESHEVQPHLQSYYLVFRPKTLRHKAFTTFWEGVSVSPRREEAIRHEITLSLWLAMHGLVPGAYVTAAVPPLHELNPTHDMWRQIIRLGAPFIKRDLLRVNRDGVDLSDWPEVVSSAGYPVGLISDYLGSQGTGQPQDGRGAIRLRSEDRARLPEAKTQRL